METDRGGSGTTTPYHQPLHRISYNNCVVLYYYLENPNHSINITNGRGDAFKEEGLKGAGNMQDELNRKTERDHAPPGVTTYVQAPSVTLLPGQLTTAGRVFF
jgi:hypothetical protein